MRMARRLLMLGGLGAIGLTPLLATGAVPAVAENYGTHMHIDCSRAGAACTELADSTQTFGHYVGHDEPEMHFFSNTAGAGNRMRYEVVLPKDPSFSNPTTPGKSYTTEIYNSTWFGMTLCDTQSYPEQVNWCNPDSDSNIVDPAFSPKHPGAAFLELQFYPPGWVQWPTWAVAAGTGGCDPTRWCAALNIDSLSEDPVNGTTQNATCASKVGLEYVNFAFLTHDGTSTGPANPVDATASTFTPDPRRDFFMNPGDSIQVELFDTNHGLETKVLDKSTGQTGLMIASASNGFAQVKYDPTGTSCTALPYDFHPMYSTSSTKTILPWGADQDSVSFNDEIGHFQYCNGTPPPATPFGVDSNGNPTTCPAGDTEEIGPNQEPTDSDDAYCFPGSEAPRLHISACTNTNTGFDAVEYTPVWPDGNTAMHPTPMLFSSPQTGPSLNQPYSRAGFEVDLPDIEYANGTCDRSTGAGCSHFPTTDDGQPVQFYPFYSSVSTTWGCRWAIGDDPTGTISDFGRNSQYGPLLNSNYIAFGGGGATVTRYNSFRNILSNNPCTS